MGIQFLSLQGGGGTAVPFQRRNAPYQVQSIAVNPQDAMRLKRYEEHWRFYSGLHWSFQREDGDPLVTANYCRAIVNKKASWLVGKGMMIDVPESLEHLTKPVLDEVWDYNDLPLLLLESAITGGVTGDVFLLITYEAPSQQQKRVNPYTRGRVRIRLLGSHQVFPYWNPLNREELQFVRIVTETEVNDPQFRIDGVNSTTRTPITIGTSGIQRRRYIEDIFPDKIVEGWDDQGKVERVNDLGEIPLVHIRNEPFPNEYYGMSDLDGIIDVQREYNEKLTDVSDIVNYYAGPITVITGARAASLDRGTKKLWSGLPADARVFTLKLEGELSSSHKYLETVLQIIFDLANMPEGSLGRSMPISNTSGVALQVAFQPLIEAIERKAPGYEIGFQRANYFILRYHQLATGEAYPVDICKTCGGRIVEIPGKGGKRRTKCFMVDHQTMDFLSPEEVEINIKRKFSYGVETRLLPYWRVKEEFLKEGASFWDPQGEKDLQKEALKDQARAKAAQEFQNQNTVVDPLAPPPPPPTPTELEKPPEVKPEQLAPHDMDIPEEPEEHDINVAEWDPDTRSFITVPLGRLRVVPTGCKKPRHLNPYETKVKFRSALPRDRVADMNLYSAYLQNVLVSRHWVQRKIEEDINLQDIDKEIADDIPFILAYKGMPNPGQVAQSAGVQNGDNNGAPLPPGPGPGRSNKYVPGDNLAGRPPTGASQGGR